VTASLGGREGPALLSRPHRVPEVEGETVLFLGDVDPERRGRLRLPRAEPRTVLGVQVGVAPGAMRHLAIAAELVRAAELVEAEAGIPKA